MKCEIVKTGTKVIVYIEGMPAFINEDSKEPITPNGMVMYANNRDKIDNWLKDFPNIENVYEFEDRYDKYYTRLNQPFTTRKEVLLELYESYKLGELNMPEESIIEVENEFKFNN